PDSMEMRVLLTHMRPEVARGHLWPILPDARKCSALGYRNRGGTLDEFGMQFANRASWANVLAACARLRNVPRTALLTRDEAAAVAGKGDPQILRHDKG
ncbi:MAG TPA: xylulose 5-phosphate 3-epimerase, partial [Pseudomonas sp.]|nr:xylulose 5-phosphate 3-epimerase [Pseudomonas sp.]